MTEKTPRQWFRAMMRQRREWPKGSLDWQWRTEAARNYLFIIMGVPASQWGKQ
jgi:hypothetical protein